MTEQEELDDMLSKLHAALFDVLGEEKTRFGFVLTLSFISEEATKRQAGYASNITKEGRINLLKGLLSHLERSTERM